MKIDVGRQFSFYLDEENGVFVIETRSIKPAKIIEIPVSRILTIKDVVWNEGESFEDVSLKKPEKVQTYPKINEETVQ